MKMQSLEDRLRELEVRMTISEKLNEEHRIEEAEVHTEIRDTLSYIKQRNTRVDEFIESEITVRKESAEFWKDVRTKLTTASILGVVGLVFSVGWYAIQHFVQNGGR